ncbi:MAG: hypothetical protein ACO39T_07580 [Flavobacteriaceae bacterium]
MIRFTVVNGSLTPSLPADATEQEKTTASLIATKLNSVQSTSANYKQLIEGINRDLQAQNLPAKDFIDKQTVGDIEAFYEKAAGVTPWDSAKQGTDLAQFDATFYSGLVPEKVQAWKDANTAISFAGQTIADVDITKRYPDLNSYLHADYTFVGAPAGLPGKQRELTAYTETLRPPTDREQQILRETLLGVSATQPSSLAELASQNYVDVQGEQAFGALTADVLKQTLDEYSANLKKDQMGALFRGMGLPDTNLIKQDIKNAILGDLGSGGFTAFGKGLSSSLDKSLGLGSSVKYNWQEWFDRTLAERYRTMQEIKDPEDATKTYQIEKEFANQFIDNYLKPRFDTSKSISEFISYMDVAANEQNVLQTQLASSALKDFANKQAETFLTDLGTKTTTKDFDPRFYVNPELLSGTDVTSKASLYASQKEDVNAAWENRNAETAVANGRTWAQLAYEYGLDVNNKDDFARLHYEVLGKNKGYDPVADSYTRNDLANFIQQDLATALQNEKTSYSNPVFVDFVSADAKANELVGTLNVAALPPELKTRLAELGVNETEDPIEKVRESLADILRTDPALQIRTEIQALNEQNIKPTQEQLGIGYIQRDTDEKTTAPTGGTALFSIFQKAGYSGTESEFYRDFFPDATEEDKNLGQTKGTVSTAGGVQGLFGFSGFDSSDPFAAIASIEKMFSDTGDTQDTTPTKADYFSIFQDEEDAGAPSYFKIGTSATPKKTTSSQSFLGDFSSFFG